MYLSTWVQLRYLIHVGFCLHRLIPFSRPYVVKDTGPDLYTIQIWSCGYLVHSGGYLPIANAFCVVFEAEMPSSVLSFLYFQCTYSRFRRPYLTTGQRDKIYKSSLYSLPYFPLFSPIYMHQLQVNMTSPVPSAPPPIVEFPS